jgi:ribosomal peptide maturation radical SAM protein 1
MSFKALFISLPWADYRSPSLSAGTLTSHARKQGFDVEAVHLHLPIAADFGLRSYSDVMFSDMPIGEAMSAALLFPQHKNRLQKFVGRHSGSKAGSPTAFSRAMRRSFRTLDLSNCSIVCFTVDYQQLFSSILFSKWIKSEYTNIRTVVQGKMARGDLGASVIDNFSQVDWCIGSEGEVAIPALMRCASSGAALKLKQVPGLIYRRGGKTVRNAPSSPLKMKGLPDPDYDNYFKVLESHSALKGVEVNPFLPIEQSRGCNMQCAFCNDPSYWGRHRSRPSREVVDSIRRLCKKHRVNSIHLSAQMITPQISDGLFRDLASHANDYRITCEVRPGTRRKSLELMKNAGVTEVRIGIENLCSKLLRKMKKGSRLIDNLETMKLCEELGIRNDSDFMVGFPNETQNDVDSWTANVDFADPYLPPAALTQFQLLEGSPVCCSPSRYGISNISDAGPMGPYLPKHLKKGIRLNLKTYKSSNRKRNYSRLKARIDSWRRAYDEAASEGLSLLRYFDCRDFVKIVDLRGGTGSIILDGWMRDLYLFCEETKGFAEIEKSFSTLHRSELLKVLRQLYRLKAIYTEGGDWLSLAVRSRPGDRRDEPFL